VVTITVTREEMVRARDEMPQEEKETVYLMSQSLLLSTQICALFSLVSALERSDVNASLKDVEFSDPDEEELQKASESCPRCKVGDLDSWRRPDGRLTFFCHGCHWAGDEWTIQTFSQLRSQIEDLEEHIKELGSEALHRMIIGQEGGLPLDIAPKEPEDIEAVGTDPASKPTGKKGGGAHARS
jgi:hypothetical protein